MTDFPLNISWRIVDWELIRGGTETPHRDLSVLCGVLKGPVMIWFYLCSSDEGHNAGPHSVESFFVRTS